MAEMAEMVAMGASGRPCCTAGPQVDVTIDDCEPDEITVIITGANEALVNGLRACALEHVDKLAIRTIRQLPTTDASDAFAIPAALKTRLALVPIDSRCVYDNAVGSPRAARRMVSIADCPCGGALSLSGLPACKDCTVTFCLQASNPLHATDDLFVYGRELVCISGHATSVTAPDLILWRLAPGETLALLAIADVSRGIVHAAYSPTTVVRVHPQSDVRVVRDIEDLMTPKQRAYNASFCLTGAIGFSVATQRIVVLNEYACTACGDCVKQTQIVYTPSGAERHVSPMRVAPVVPAITRMTIETDGTLPAARVFLESMRHIKTRLAECIAGVAPLVDPPEAREFSPMHGCDDDDDDD